MHVLQRPSFFTAVAKFTVLSGRCPVFMWSPEYSNEIGFLWYVAKNRHSWLQSRRFCGSRSPFLLDSLFPVTARSDCLSGEGNRARAGAAMTRGSCFPVAPTVQDWRSANRRQEQDTSPCSDLAKPCLRMLQEDQVSPETSSQQQLPVWVCFLRGCGLHWTWKPRLRVQGEKLLMGWLPKNKWADLSGGDFVSW